MAKEMSKYLTALDSLEKNGTEAIKNLEQTIQHLNTENTSLKNNVNELGTLKEKNVQLENENNSLKEQHRHLETFRNELIREREAHQKTRNEFETKIQELTSQIEYLQLTPAKRKKIDEEKNKVVEVEVVSTLPIEESIRDGGSF